MIIFAVSDIIAIVLTLFIFKVLNAEETPADSEACFNHTVIADSTRLFHYTQTTDNCDSYLVEGWYRFEVDGNPAQIPRACMKSERSYCGTRLPMRLDLGDQSLPGPNSTIPAYACTSFDILGKWDCCVLRQRVWIRNCETFFIYHLRPTDRCDVGYCIQEPGNNPSEEYTAKTGEHTRHLASEMFLQPISVLALGDDMSRDVTSTSPIADVDDMLITTHGMQEALTVPPLYVSQHGRHVPQPPCPPWNGFPCINGTRRCHLITGEYERAVTIIECTNGRGCGRYCDNIADCEDHSDENICPTIVCSEDRRLCPSEDVCFSRCDGVQECSNGSDEQGCDDEPHEVTISTISVLQLNTTSTTRLDSSIRYDSSVFQSRTMHGYTSTETLMTDSIRLHSMPSSALLPSSSIPHDSVAMPLDNTSVISPTQTVRLQSSIAKMSSSMDSIESDNIPEQTERPTSTVLESSFIVKIPSASIEMTGMLASAIAATDVSTSPITSNDRFYSLSATADIVYFATASTEIFSSSLSTATVLSSSIASTDIFSSTTTTVLLSSSIATTKTLANISTEVNDSLTRSSRFSQIDYMDNSTSSNTVRITATSIIDTVSVSMFNFQTQTPASIITETPMVNSSLESTQMADPAIAPTTTILDNTSQSSTVIPVINTSSLINTSYQGRPTPVIPSSDATDTVGRRIITSPIYTLTRESPSPMYSTFGDYGKIATESMSAEPFQTSVSVTPSSYNTQVTSSLLVSSIESPYNSSLNSTVETTTTSVRKMPSIVTFAIIGTAYRKVKLQEKVREPTFEDMLKAAIADVLNEYSDRNRRSVQNFTDQQVHVTNISFAEDNATISLAVNSTKQGESYISVDELLAVFNNESAIDLLCQKLLHEVHSQLLQTSYSISETSTLPESSLSMTISRRQMTSDFTSLVATTMSIPSPSEFTTSVSPITSLHVTSESLSRVTSTTSIQFASELSTTVAPATSIHVYNESSSSVAPTASIQFANASYLTDAPTTSIQYASESTLSVAPASQIRVSASATESQITSSSSVSIRQSELFDPVSTQIWDRETYVQSTQIITSIASSQVSQTDIALNDSIFSTKTKIHPIRSVFTTSLSATLIESSSLTDQSFTSIPYSSTAGHVTSTPIPVLSDRSAHSSYATPLQPSYVLPVTDSSFKSDSSYLSSIVTPHISTSLIPLHIESSQISQSTSLESDRVTQQTIQETIQKPQTQNDSPLLSLSPSVQDTAESTSVKIKELSSFNVYSLISTATDVPTHPYIASVASSKHDSVTMTSVYTPTSTLETVTDNQTKDGNQTKDIKSREDEQEGLIANTGLVVFLIIVVAVILGTCIFAVVGTIYRRRMHTWNPQMAYQDAYADIEKDKLSFHRDVLGIESPIPDVDILKSELEQQETSLSKASTMTLPPTPKNGTSQCDVALTPGPSNEYIEINKSGSPQHLRNETDGRGCINKGFEEDRDSGLDGIVPVGEIDNLDPRKSFPWIEQLEDTRL